MNPWHQFIDDLTALSDRWTAQCRTGPKTRGEALIQRTRAECGLEFSTILMRGLERVKDAEAPNVSTWAVEDASFIDHLAARVHVAWMAEKQRQGYADHVWPGKTDVVFGTVYPPSYEEFHEGCRFAKSVHHAEMVPFDQLSEAAKEYERATVRAVLAALITEEDTP